VGINPRRSLGVGATVPGTTCGAMPVHDSPSGPRNTGALREVAEVFLKLGLIGFGGPAATIALMRDEVVARRKWLTDAEFLDLVGASNLIPGPTATEMAIFLGYARGGWRALILAGALFLLPAVVLVLAIAWAYVRYGSAPEATWLLYGIKPVIIAVVVQALWGLTKAAAKGPFLVAVGIAVGALYFLGVSPVTVMIGGALVVLVVENATRLHASLTSGLALPGSGLSLAAAAVPYSPWVLFVTFLKIGVVLFGGGYVLLAFLHADFVDHLGWLTDRQLIDAVAVGQFTPGPLFTTATFVGYVVGGLPGAIVATVAIFLPSFVIAALVFPLVPRLRHSPWLCAFLDGANASALGLMAAVTWQLARAAIVDGFSLVLALLAALVLLRFKPNPAWLVLGGGVLGVLYRLVA